MADNKTQPPLKNSSKLTKLRKFMEDEGLNGYTVFMGDRHDTEYPGPRDKRVAFMCGFTGSAGTCLITMDNAYFWTDGRYFKQAAVQLEDNWTLMKMVPGVPTLEEFIKSQAKWTHIGFDAYTTSMTDYKKMENTLKHTLKLRPYINSPIDKIWGENQPNNKMEPIYSLPISVHGKSCANKLYEIREKMKTYNCTALATAALDEVAWIFNLRGSDIPDSPLFYSYAFITLNEAFLFTNKKVMQEEAWAAIADQPFTVENYEDLSQKLTHFSNTKKVWIDPRCSYGICASFPFHNVFFKNSPIAMMKAVKNETEMACMREIHIKDGAALCRFIHWCEKERDYILSGNVTELDLAEKAKFFRAKNPDFLYPSFETISACGEHASMGHYSIPNKEELFDVRMKPCVHLFDSGGQYLSGSTDIGRTLHFGEPNDVERQIYTLIAKGHINIAKAVFPHGITGPQIDVFGREFLWKAGLTYFHGTGHGVGHCLPIHEGPCRMDGTKLWSPFIDTPLLPGMILSDEPTFSDGGLGLPFGMQIENIIIVREVETPYKTINSKFYGFEVISWAPIEKKLLNTEMMTKEEIEWVNDYHSKVYKKVSTFFRETYTPKDEQDKKEVEETIEWLYTKTSPLQTM